MTEAQNYGVIYLDFRLKLDYPLEFLYTVFAHLVAYGFSSYMTCYICDFMGEYFPYFCPGSFVSLSCCRGKLMSDGASQAIYMHFTGGGYRIEECFCILIFSCECVRVFMSKGRPHSILNKTTAIRSYKDMTNEICISVMRFQSHKNVVQCIEIILIIPRIQVLLNQ